MNPWTEYKIVSLAKKVREDLVDIYRGQPHTNNYQDMYLLDSGFWRFFDEDFGGACGVASYMLSLAARKDNIPLILTGHARHCFCKTPDGTIVDPTYSQYSPREPIYVGRAKSYHMATDDYPIVEGTRVKDLLKRYPKIQNPFSDYHRKPIQRWLNSL
jgi:hypothetical protein